jgi:ClpA/ClpB-like protein
MDYRGQDLDLRTSRWSASSTEPSGWREAAPPTPQPVHSAPQPALAPRPTTQRSGPIWVDETLLACANHAYDVALAYRSAEVRLEHLLLAMTRVEAAAIALEARGVRVTSLRRDSAVTIAGELPATNADGNVSPRRSPELEDVLRLAASRASHAGRAANVDDVVQVLGDVGGNLPGAELIVRHFPRLNRDFWGSLGPARAAPHGGASHLLDIADAERSPNAAPMPSAAVDQTLVQRIFERLAETERAFSERLAALEFAIAQQSSPGHADLSPIDNRLSAIESALHNRPLGEGIAAIDPALSDRLWAIEQAFGTERSERASAITALSDEITGVRSAVRLAAQNSEQTQASITEQMQQLASGIGERIGNIEQLLDAHTQKTNEAHAAYSADLSEVHEALMKISANQHTLAGAIDNWRNNDSGEIHLINTRIGAVHEDGARRLAAIEKLCADVETLSHLVIDDKSRPRGSFKQWLFGTDDWIKASWRAPKAWRPTVKWPRVAWRRPLKRRSS